MSCVRLLDPVSKNKGIVDLYQQIGQESKEKEKAEQDSRGDGYTGKFGRKSGEAGVL